MPIVLTADLIENLRRGSYTEKSIPRISEFCRPPFEVPMRVARFLVAIALLLALPVAAMAQAAITGTVKDSSAAVLPGVTVEASSPALIEKVRTGVSDGNGVYRIEDLRPGTYTVTFTLPGFKTYKREGIVLTGTFTASV